MLLPGPSFHWLGFRRQAAFFGRSSKDLRSYEANLEWSNESFKHSSETKSGHKVGINAVHL